MKCKTVHRFISSVVIILGWLRLSPAGAARVDLESKTSKKALRANNSKSGKAKQVCKEYCNLYSSALKRCPYPPSNEEIAEADTCVEGCIKASFDKYGSDQDFILKDTVQCRMNHAKMAIKEGSLTNSKHCLHATFGGPERCTADVVSLTSAAQSAAGKLYFYYISASLKEAGTDISKMAQIYLASISYLIELRGRLFVAYPNFENEPKNMKSMFTKKLDCETPAKKLFRTADGTCNSLEMPLMGSTNTPFVHSLKPSELHRDGEVDVAEVAKIMKRPYGKPPPETLQPFNQLASAWIQFMTHDWFQHNRFEKSKNGALHNRVTHWWDASQIYGSSKEEEDNVRLSNGKIHLDENDELDYDKNGVPRTGFGENFWVGLHVFHTVFAREHNYIVDSLGTTYPEMTSDQKYDTSRLCISAILAKIHFLEWTPTLLDNSVSTLSLNANWYGLKTAVSGFFTPEQLAPLQETINSIKIPAVMTNDFGTNLTMLYTPFQMTEEFVSVYRMHPLLPDEIEVGDRNLTLQEFSFQDARGLIQEKNAAEVFLQALSKAPARVLSLRNYPYTLYDLNIPGRGKVNLAEIDLTRDRERNLPRYNDARRQLLLEPYSSLDNLTDNVEDLKLLKSIYTDIEQVDFMVGCLADKERPEGFAFGIVPYHIFVVMASRRVFSDRFLQEGLTADNYTPWGLNYLSTETFQSILIRQFPALDGVVPANPFSNQWSF